MGNILGSVWLIPDYADGSQPTTFPNESVGAPDIVEEPGPDSLWMWPDSKCPHAFSFLNGIDG